ncbi:hypothetical protein RhiirA5_485868 [Rhizophagus irregularis]|uniref:Uncharacterized protein n=1 Tax=Rhizophagus irregularis TaxID=588596 RepID=A0A2I1F8A1_9GLOM|nr:hypothetical protein RhiirA5_485868 [Rhizophagus irregularis]PKY30587.1 hypothetical protein RhiirB3_486874 [Rhizophagus irregularis]
MSDIKNIVLDTVIIREQLTLCWKLSVTLKRALVTRVSLLNWSNGFKWIAIARHNNATDVGILYIEALKRNLKYLKVGYNRVTDKGVKELEEMSQLLIGIIKEFCNDDDDESSKNQNIIITKYL